MFAGKMSFTLPTSHLAPPLAFPDGRFWTAAIHWPVKGIFLFSLMVVLWRWGKFKYPYLGLTWKPNELAWYLKLFLYIFPFLILASLSADFTQTYPRLKAVFFLESITPGYPLYFLIYELCYGTDFFTIEVFFRGFLVLAFVRYAGVNAILPMAAFYCAIHFGKPLAECISSYFGGILLGTVVYRQQSVWGGLLIHLGIAWSMEILSLLHLIS